MIVNEIIPETEDEQEWYKGAMKRRQLRLLLAGRMKAEDATVLKEMFE